MCATWSPELSFVPIRAPHALSKRAADALATRINAEVRKMKTIARLFYAKSDPHLGQYTARPSYLVEVVCLPGCYLETEWVDRSRGQWKAFRAAIDGLFTLLRDSFGLVPTLVTEARDGTPIHWPGGGCHLHYGADLFPMSPRWYSQMEAFHRNLIVDYANRPYLTWLFRQWFVNGEGSRTPLNLDDYATDKRGKCLYTADELYQAACRHSRGIEARYMTTSKASYLTFEFRLFSMVANADQLGSIARFTHAWVQSLVAATLAGRTIGLSLTRARLRDYSTLHGSLAACQSFLDSLGLPWQDYASMYETHYVNRIKHGQMV